MLAPFGKDALLLSRLFFVERGWSHNPALGRADEVLRSIPPGRPPDFHPNPSPSRPAIIPKPAIVPKKVLTKAFLLLLGWGALLGGGPWTEQWNIPWAQAQTASWARVELPQAPVSLPVKITAEQGAQWTEGSYQVWCLQGRVEIVQGSTTARGEKAVLWIASDPGSEPGRSKVIAYLEGQVAGKTQGPNGQAQWADQTWLGRWTSDLPPEVHVQQLFAEPRERPAWYYRAQARRREELAQAVQATQWVSRQGSPALAQQGQVGQGSALSETESSTGLLGQGWRPHSVGSEPGAVGNAVSPQTSPNIMGSMDNFSSRPEPAPGVQPETPLGTESRPQLPGPSASIPASPSPLLQQPAPPGPVAKAPTTSTRRIRVFSRSDVRIRAQWFPNAQTNQGIAVIDGGVNILIDDAGQWGTLDISADRMVIWTRADQEPGLSGEAIQDADTPLEIYMEGNVEFRQGQRVIHADRLYYDVPRHWGTILGAEVLTPAPKYEGLLRLRAEILQQTGPGRFFAQDGFVTSSRLGTPRYRLQASEVYFEDIQSPQIDSQTGQVRVDPQTGQPLVEQEQNLTSRHNFLFLEEVPVLYWPWMAADLSDPTLYIRRVRYKSDKTFGQQILSDWNAYQIFGIRSKPAGTKWDASLDYLDKRGLGHGTTFTYNRDNFLGIAGPVAGLVDYWGIKDDGEDLLSGRGWLEPESEYRYRLFWQHRQQIAQDYLLSAEVHWISDRNFLEQYYQKEWETFKDFTTGVELRRVWDHISWAVSADVQINDFLTQTEWLPRTDLFILGQNVAEGLTWFAHSGTGYARFRTGAAPTTRRDAALFSYLPWESPASPGSAGVPLEVEGERLFTRQEIDWPFQIGVVKVVPYALGEATHWGEDRTGDDLQRLYWQVGVRASVPIWRTFPEVESHLWNVHGLAHKVTFDAEFAFAEANRDMTDLPLYDPLDDDAIEALRRRFAVRTFRVPAGTVAAIPWAFDERSYALRTGLASWVTAPVEVADDLTTFRLGMHHRLQTKRGLPEQRRIIDWMTLDTNLTIFPNADRDNFGTGAGLLDYHYRWFIGDRLTLVSTGLFDFFHNGAQLITIGGYLQRPPRGQLYLGLNLLEGPFQSQVVTASFSYQMSPKWIATVGASVDLTGDNIGQNFSVTRIGESLIVNLGVSVDDIREDVGVFFSVEPRFLPKRRIGGAGNRISVAGLETLE